MVRMKSCLRNVFIVFSLGAVCLIREPVLAQDRAAVEVHPEVLAPAAPAAAQSASGIRAPMQLRMPGSNEIRVLPSLQYPSVTQRAVQTPTQKPTIAARETPQTPVYDDEIVVTRPKTPPAQASQPKINIVETSPAPAAPAMPAPSARTVASSAPAKATTTKPAAREQTQPAASAPRPSAALDPLLAAEPDPDLMAGQQTSLARATPTQPAPKTKAPSAPAVPAAAVSARAQPEPAATPLSGGGVSVLFNAASSELSADARRQLDALANLHASSDARLKIEAYAGAAGDRSSEARRLSLKRGLAVRSYLMSKGVSGARIETQALGGAARGNPERVDVRRQDS